MLLMAATMAVIRKCASVEVFSLFRIFPDLKSKYPDYIAHEIKQRDLTMLQTNSSKSTVRYISFDSRII